jgi:hypothetical protein
MLTAEEYKRAEFDLTLADSKRGFKIHALVYALGLRMPDCRRPLSGIGSASPGEAFG